MPSRTTSIKPPICPTEIGFSRNGFLRRESCPKSSCNILIIRLNRISKAPNPYCQVFTHQFTTIFEPRPSANASKYATAPLFSRPSRPTSFPESTAISMSISCGFRPRSDKRSLISLGSAGISSRTDAMYSYHVASELIDATRV
jgi:hypothetical protein